MLSRRRSLVGLCCAALMFMAAACRPLPVGEALSTAIAQPTAPLSGTTSLFDNVVWARIPYCDCLDGIVTDNVSAALKRAQLAGTVKTLNQTNGWMYFVVAFDPQTDTRDQIAAAIVAGGGEVVDGPP
ncbi:MAG: hypothetical protein ABI847_18520 [Anaerolineales bacterium]